MNSQQPIDAAMQGDTFQYEGYQVVHGEFFSHSYEPSVTLGNCKLSVNMACLKKLPNIYYVQALVNPEEKKLAIRPCDEDAKDSFLWRSSNRNMLQPKQITCRIFFAKIVKLMDWNVGCRYKLLGKLIRSSEESIFVFDLTTPEIYRRTLQGEDQPSLLRTPAFPLEWQHQFGLPVEEHRQTLQINTFQGYTVFQVADTAKPKITQT